MYHKICEQANVEEPTEILMYKKEERKHSEEIKKHYLASY